MSIEQPPQVTNLNLNRDFNVYWLGQTLSVFGNAFGTLAVPLLVLDTTGSLVQMGVVSAVYAAFRLIAGVLVGPVVDALDRKRLMVFCDVARTVLYGAVPVVWLVEPQLWLLYVCAAGGAVFSLTFQVAHVSMVADLVDRSQLVDANSRLETSSSISYIVGPMLAGVVAAAVGAENALAIDAVSFVGSAVAILMLPAPSEPDVEDERNPYAATELSSWWSSFTDGISFLWHQPAMRWLMILLTAFTLVTASADDILIYWLQEVLELPKAATGVVFGVSALGGLGAAVLAPVLHRRFAFDGCWFGAFAVVGVSLGALPLATHAWSVSIVGVLFAFGTTLAGVSSMSLRQELTPSRLLGRVTAAFWTVTTALAPLGAVVLTAASEAWGVGPVCVTAGVAFVLLLGAGLRTPLRQPYTSQKVMPG